MGVANLWQSLGHCGAVEAFSGATPDGHARLMAEVQGTAVAVDLSPWIVQAATQPALQEHYATPTARALHVVLWRTAHWLRHGCLPVFVVEGATPPEKMERLRERFAARTGAGGGGGGYGGGYGGDVMGFTSAMAAGPRARGNQGAASGGGRSTNNNNNANQNSGNGSSRLDATGRAVRELLDALGVPHVQAVGEAEATCAALSACGWVGAAATLDVDALLFGAQAVWRQAHLPYDAPNRAELVMCRMSSVRRALGLERGGQAALVAVAQLAGGDYHVRGAARVGDALALQAVRALLAGAGGNGGDEGVCRALAEALERGPDPALAALTKCTGCRTCGHESGGRGAVARHAAKGRTAGCAQCGTARGCVPQHLQRRGRGREGGGVGRRRGAGKVVASSGSGRLGPLGAEEDEEEDEGEGAAVVVLLGSEEEEGEAEAAAGAAGAGGEGSEPEPDDSGEDEDRSQAGRLQAPPGPGPGPVACSCRFHASADARTLNRVVALALATPGFCDKTRRALGAYARQTQAALSAVLREYGVPGHSAAEAAAALEDGGGGVGREDQAGAALAAVGPAAATGAADAADPPASASLPQQQQQQQQHENVFRWRHRPDVARVAAIMVRHCGGSGSSTGGGGNGGGGGGGGGGGAHDWSRAAARLRLMPLLLEWDLRQGAEAFRSAAARRAAGGVQFRPTAIRKVSTRGYAQGGFWGTGPSGGGGGEGGGDGGGGDGGGGGGGVGGGGDGGGGGGGSQQQHQEATAPSCPDLYPPGGWRYILEVERVVERGEEEGEEGEEEEEVGEGGERKGGGDGGGANADGDRKRRALAREDLRTDRAWLNGTLRLREPAAGSAPSSPAMQPSQPASPGPPPPPPRASSSHQQLQQQQPLGSAVSTPQGKRAAAAAQGPPAQAPSYYAEHRTVRRALVDALWPELSAAFAAKRGAAVAAARQREVAAAARRARAAEGWPGAGGGKGAGGARGGKPWSAAAAATLVAAQDEDEAAAAEADARAAVAAAERAAARGKISRYFSPSPSPSRLAAAAAAAAAARTPDESPLASIPSLAQRLQLLRAGGGDNKAAGALLPPPRVPVPVVAEVSPAKRVRMGAGGGACYDVLLGELPSASPAKKQQQQIKSFAPRRALFGATVAAAAKAGGSSGGGGGGGDVIDLTQADDDDDDDEDGARGGCDAMQLHG